MTHQEILEFMKTATPNSALKDFLPIATTLVGIVVGFSLNYIRDLITTRKSEKLNCKLLKEELDLALEDSIDLAKRLCESLDEKVEKGTIPWVYVSEMSNVCFNSFYPQIIKSYTREQRRCIHEAYAQISFINTFSTKEITNRDTTQDLPKAIHKLNDIFIACLKLYRAHQNLYLHNALWDISIERYLRETKIQSKFYQSMVDREIK
ncbi:hypothetical protein SGI63_000574 [Enterobacter cloacae]|nr:hypothetical protein [Enterobacter cloacae]